MKIAFVGNASKEMYLFRGDIMQYFKNKGHDIVVIVPKGDKNYNEYNFREIFLPLERKGTNPFKDYFYYRKLKKIYKEEKFDIIFHYSIKPNIYGSRAAYKAKTKSVAITTGLGYVFLYNDLKSMIARFLYKINLKYASEIWFLNEDDKKDFLKYNLVKESKTFVIPSEGIDINYFLPIEKNILDNKIKILLIGRILKDKGIYEYFEVASKIKENFKNIEFQLLGYLDKDNPSCIDERLLKKNINSGIINYLGITDDVRNYIKEADLVVLPSYREGIPRSLMEAMSMEKPIITTSAVGCKDLIVDGYNGFICEPKDIGSFYNALIKFLNLSEEQKISQGKNGREFVKKKFSIDLIKKIYNNQIEKLHLW